MRTLSLANSSMSKFSPHSPFFKHEECAISPSSRQHHANEPTPRQHPAPIAKAQQCFTYVAQALEAETLQGQTAQRAVAAARKLVQLAGLDAAQLLNSLPPETQGTVKAFFG